MNKVLTTLLLSTVVIGSANAGSIHAKDVKVSYWGSQERANAHFQGEMTDFKKEVRPQLKDLYGQIESVREWTDRQEGAFSAGLRDSVDRDAKLSQAIQDEQTAREVTEGRSVNNAERLDVVEGGVRETNTQVTADREASVQRDLAETKARVEGDAQLASQVQYNAAVNKAYQQQTAQQFAKQEAALASERHDRQEADTDLKAGVASAIAIGSHHFDTNYRGMQMSLAGGFYDGENAQSLSVGGAITDNVFGSVAASTDSRGKQAYSVQSTIKF